METRLHVVLVSCLKLHLLVTKFALLSNTKANYSYDSKRFNVIKTNGIQNTFGVPLSGSQPPG